VRVTATSPGQELPRRSWRRFLTWLVVLASSLYLGLLGLLLWFEDRLVFRPTPAREDWAEPPLARVQDVSLTSADGTRLHAWWCPTEPWQPAQGAVLYCHGNAGNVSDCGRPLLEWQQPPLPQAVFLIDYPGYGRSEGAPSEAGCYAAADAAYDWLAEIQQVPPERILLFGRSLGGGVVTDLARRRPHRALVLCSTFSSMPDMATRLFPFLPGRWLMHNQFDNLAKISHCRRPVFITHSSGDQLIPISQAERLFAAANEPKELFRVEGLAHDRQSPELYERLKRFLDEVERQEPLPVPTEQ
jgi:fermentation-respiration switch protein FrsA (DUF1100 family)